MAIERPHLLISNPGRRLEYAARGRGGKPERFPTVQDRQGVARRILREIKAVIAAAEADPISAEAGLAPMTVRASAAHGVNSSIPGPRRNAVMSVLGFDRVARVNVALDPSSYVSFEKAAERYVEFDGRKRPHHFNFFESRPTVATTTVDDLWAATVAPPDLEDVIAWEVWLQPVAEPRFREALEQLELPNPPRAIEFTDMRVIGLEARRADFDQIARSASIAQLRPASSLNSRILQGSPGIRAAAVTAAAGRVTVAEDDAPAVCLLDTGVNAEHPLLKDSIRFQGAVGLVRGTRYAGDDLAGHGTQMAGVALFEDLAGLMNRGSEALSIRLESVSIEPPDGALAAGSLPAARVREAVDLIERAHPAPRTFCLAMNSTEEPDDGAVSSLSCEIDLLAFEVAGPRLFCVAAGNLDEAQPAVGDYQALNEVSGIRSPAQAWNALTVAACTHLDAIPAPHGVVAPSGDLSPWSRTSVNWEGRYRPPSKPDVVFEGGNQSHDTALGVIGQHRNLSLLTTSHDLNDPLALTAMTSAATAGVAGLCVRLQAEYPRYWPETVRGLVAHGADYTQAMRQRAGQAAAGLPTALLERFGYGVPNPAQVYQNAEDALTLVIQSNTIPLRLNDTATNTILGYMRFHALPWPIEILEGLGEIKAELRVTLSYFVEPNPGHALRGETDLYASHGLDFDVMRPDENDDQAIGRINGAHQVAGRRSSAPPLNWMWGRSRGRGGLRHDRLRTTAADLARMGGIAVFPRKGWWSKDHLEQQVRYSLIVTIRTPGQDIYTEIANGIAVET